MKANIAIADIEAEVTRLRALGWTQADFAQALKCLLTPESEPAVERRNGAPHIHRPAFQSLTPANNRLDMCVCGATREWIQFTGASGAAFWICQAWKH